ncbi:MAG: hypothetical protein H7X92_02225 [Chitinophagales bacterium]|nr:hypothetical protein [Hyphomicrobiales bacterium]
MGQRQHQFNTGHPHSHVIIRDKTDRGKALGISPAYISHAIRLSAQEKQPAVFAI